jgi:hypothetical protein
MVYFKTRCTLRTLNLTRSIESSIIIYLVDNKDCSAREVSSFGRLIKRCISHICEQHKHHEQEET